jgi:hypothetical protein
MPRSRAAASKSAAVEGDAFGISGGGIHILGKNAENALRAVAGGLVRQGALAGRGDLAEDGAGGIFGTRQKGDARRLPREIPGQQALWVRLGDLFKTTLIGAHANLLE